MELALILTVSTIIPLSVILLVAFENARERAAREKREHEASREMYSALRKQDGFRISDLHGEVARLKKALAAIREAAAKEADDAP